MKTTEQINQIKTLKSFIAETVKSHKETKKIARMSSKSADYNVWHTASAQSSCLEQAAHLFVLYTAYYILRHNVDPEEYCNSVFRILKEEKKLRYYQPEKFGVTEISCPTCWHMTHEKHFYEVVNTTIKCLEKYVESKSNPKE